MQIQFRKFIERPAFHYVLAALSFFFAWQRLILLDFQIPFWGDEALTILSSVNFWKTGVFSSALGMTKGFEKTVSTGLLSVWPSGLGWLWGGSVFWARFAFFIYHLALLILIVYLATKLYKIQFNGLWLALSLLLYSQTINFVPYAWMTGIANVGEWSGSIFLGIALIYFRRRPQLCAFLLGMTVWHTKFIYLPFSLIPLTLSYFSGKPFENKFLVGTLKNYFYFFIPAIIWIFWIGLVRGPQGLKDYFTLQESMSFRLFHEWSLSATGHNGVPEGLGFFQTLKARLQTPRIEWYGYDFGNKTKIILWGLCPIFWFFLIEAKKSWKERIHYFGYSAVFFVISLWYFQYHIHMWIRHYQPTLFVGYGATLLILLRALSRRSPHFQNIFLTIVIIIFGTRELMRFPQLKATLASETYTQRYSYQCALKDPYQLTVFYFADHCSPADDHFGAAMHGWYDGFEAKPR